MNTELLGIARFRFKDGKRDEFLRLSEQARELVRANEPGTLQYDVYLNADQTEAMVIERYRDSVAAMWHAENVGPMFAAVFETVDLVHGELLGDLSPVLQERLAGSEAPAVFLPYWKDAG
ncbi:MAG TPA: antibiotic biosynthesis monooxygenase [Candidatus Limnocylindrales bacterium]|nr:antibiotic biosynthesis monooxygenase [Candidatus Limnocylindrales bacterium]